MQEHSLHQKGSDLGGSPKGGEGNPSRQTPMGTPVVPQQVEADYRDETIKSFAENILRIGRECRALADENKTLKAEFETFMTTPTSRLLRAKQAENACLAIENGSLKEEVKQFKFILEEERQISRQDWAGLRCEHDRVKRALEQAEAENVELTRRCAEYEDLVSHYKQQRDEAVNDCWRPIETAPMDGTDILCFCVEPEFEGEENPWTEFRVCFYGVLTEGESCWMSHYGYEQRPTHWMPLPKPPAAKEGKPTE